MMRAVLLALLLVTPASPAAAQVGRWSDEIAAAATRFGLPESWIRRVMQAESAGRTEQNGRKIVSPKGAMGLMQLMPATWLEMRAAHRLGPDPFNPRDNVLAGAAYLRAMYDRFGYPGLFGAYNAGPERYAQHVRSGRPLPAETRVYLAKTSARPRDAARRVVPPASPAILMAVAEEPSRPPPDPLFAIRR